MSEGETKGTLKIPILSPAIFLLKLAVDLEQFDICSLELWFVFLVGTLVVRVKLKIMSESLGYESETS